ncbi:hypothetical protein LguiA_034964 [Lonicera macranthoides]
MDFIDVFSSYYFHVYMLRLEIDIEMHYFQRGREKVGEGKGMPWFVISVLMEQSINRQTTWGLVCCVMEDSQFKLI